MVEILCIAAEITAVLLILTIAIPSKSAKQSRSMDGQNGSALDSKLLIDSQGSLIAIRGVLFHQMAQWVQKLKEENTGSESRASAIQRLKDHLGLIEPLLISSSADSSARIGSREDLESLVASTEQWSSWTDEPIWIGLIQMDNVEQHDELLGPVASELAVRQITSFLRERLGGLGALARFNHNTFAIALVGCSNAHAIEWIETIRCEIRQQTLSIGEAKVSYTASASAATFEHASNFHDLWERLEDGLVVAISEGANRGLWHDGTDRSWRPMSNNNTILESTTPSVKSEAEVKTERQDEDDAHKPIAPIENPETPANTPSDPVFSEDISALFKAAQSHQKSKTSLPIPAKPNETSNDSEGENTTDIKNDIAALFAVAKSQHTSSSKPENSKPTETNAPVMA